MAVALRVLLATLATLLLRLAYLRLIGGLVLVGLAFRLLGLDVETADNGEVPASFGGAMVSIVLADAVMSPDNVLGVAAAAGDELWLLVLGLGLSMCLMLLGGSGLAALLNRWRWLTYIGAGAIAWTGSHMALRDLATHVTLPAASLGPVVPTVIAGLTIVASHVFFHLALRSRPTEGLCPPTEGLRSRPSEDAL
jgi:YjbE family integral membrane protein